LAADSSNLDAYFELAELLIEKNRGEEAITPLLDILSIDRNWGDKKAHNTLMEVFKKLG
jgi:thioredoxin-like negative regulator of GroEL